MDGSESARRLMFWDVNRKYIYKINAKMQKDRMGFGSVYHQFCIINP